jgi:hypothetical protein
MIRKLLGYDISYLDSIKTTTELLDFFYDKYEKKDNNITIYVVNSHIFWIRTSPKSDVNTI